MSHSCRFCAAPLTHLFANLGPSPLANRFLRADQLAEMEPFYPLVAYVCERCLLVQLPAVVLPECIFTDYPYFSSYSETWLAHARAYVEAMRERLDLRAGHRVIEIGSNDGYLLQFFAAAGVTVLGVEPAVNVAAAARRKGIETVTRFFGADTARQLAAEGRVASLILANNVLAHVPDLNDFVEGLRILLQPGGTLTVEFPHLLRLMESNQFDTIYHEHFSYFSLLAARRVFAAHQLTIVDVDELATHGGSLRLYAMHAAEGHEPAPSVGRVLAAERNGGLECMEAYARFADRIGESKRALLAFLIAIKQAGGTIAAYGAPAKGNTLLNYCGIRTDLIDYTVDRSPHKQGLFLPGTHIPIHAPDYLRTTRPDFVMILPWNLRDEIVAQMAEVRDWGGKFFVPIPRAEIVE